MLKGLVKAVLFFGLGIVLLTAIKIVWINLTPGQYVKYGCCGYGYLDAQQIEKERMKINICPKIQCKIELDPGYKLHTLFNALDFNK